MKERAPFFEVDELRAVGNFLATSDFLGKEEAPGGGFVEEIVRPVSLFFLQRLMGLDGFDDLEDDGVFFFLVADFREGHDLIGMAFRELPAPGNEIRLVLKEGETEIAILEIL
jgi:hypothetical protein